MVDELTVSIDNACRKFKENAKMPRCIDQAELFATAYAAWNDLLIDGRPADDEAIIAEIYGWHESTKKFTRKRILTCISWMRKTAYVPAGTGERTQTAEEKRKPRRGGII